MIGDTTMEEIRLVGKIEGFPIEDIPETINHKIQIVSNIKLSHSEQFLFNYSLRLVITQLTKENIDFSTLHGVIVMFLSDGNFSIQNTRNGFAGVTTSVIIYVINVIRRYKDINKIMAIFIEELAHHFWNIEDEIVVKHKVLEIMRFIEPDLSMEAIYDNGEQFK